MPRKPQDTWRRRARTAARDYPGLKAAERELREVRITPTFDHESAHGSFRSTEDAAIRELPQAQQRRLEAVEQAVRISATLTSGQSRVKLIELVYFTRRCPDLQTAALMVPCSVQTAKLWNSDFLLLVRSKMEGR